MMILTKHDITIEIDDQSFNVTVSKMTNEQIDTHSKKFADLPTMALEHDDRSTRMMRLTDRYELNKKLGNAAESLKALNELEVLEATPPKSYKTAKEVFDMVEEANQSRFLMTVSGKDKENLKSVMASKKISYLQIIKLIDQKIKESEEGK